MKQRILDASVIAAAFFQEEFEEIAWTLLASDCSLLAPGMIIEEVGNVIWKKFRRKEIDENEASQLLTDFLHLPFQITPSSYLIESALEIAMEKDRTVYDSLYVALAVETKSTMITADKRLVNSLADSPLEKYVMWLGDLKS